MLEEKGDGKRNDDDNGRENTCQEKCQKTGEEKRKAWSTLTEARREYQEQLEEHKNKERENKEEIKRLEEKWNVAKMRSMN